MKAEKSVHNVSRSYDRFARMLSRKIGKIDHDIEIMEAKEEAIEEGRAEGRAKGRAEGMEKGIGIGQTQVLDLMAQGFSLEEIRQKLGKK